MSTISLCKQCGTFTCDCNTREPDALTHLATLRAALNTLTDAIQEKEDASAKYRHAALVSCRADVALKTAQREFDSALDSFSEAAQR